MKLIIGLGNPGPEYAKTRHNIGFMAIDKLAADLRIDVTKNKFQALYGEGMHKGEKIVLLKPMTYMNRSGDSVSQALTWYKPKPEDIVVIYDDMDTAVGKLRLRTKGSAGGHNGIKSLIAHLGTQEFQRVRMGIGRPHPGTDVIKHVLMNFRPDEWEPMDEAVSKIPNVIDCIIDQGFTIAMNRFNG
ncbi:aminoacyl-tRNA hydrolase [Tumebacillus permanentifrigoris]|uniref:Peptidyl-tRNA hydrolase n=1 Tax=Tumebacillus permanentifrigoris TaxID=378543 RepID=A0A316D4Q3_9BACL|nr:aminoacyl-tRNA hydrolase [Tumebacillus permanentifrigoris]PWK07899.1 peptidyl-tRNA hydrolase [Tumebacillus permanentifrigoris]